MKMKGPGVFRRKNDMDPGTVFDGLDEIEDEITILE